MMEAHHIMTMSAINTKRSGTQFKVAFIFKNLQISIFFFATKVTRICETYS